MKKKMLICRDSSSSDLYFAKTFISADLNKLADMCEKVYKTYGFEMRGKDLFDGNNDDGKRQGFNCFDYVRYHKGRPIEFSHCGGDGPSIILVDAPKEV